MPSSQSGIFVFCIILNPLLVGNEALIGPTQNSLSVLSDAGHNLRGAVSQMLVTISVTFSV